MTPDDRYSTQKKLVSLVFFYWLRSIMISPYTMKKYILNFGCIALLLVVIPVETIFAYRTIYKSYIETNEFKLDFIGDQAGEQFGSSVTGGDLNGDGYDDLIIGSPYYSSEEVTWNGKVSVYFGKNDLKKRTYDASVDSPDLVVYGRASGDQLGTSVATGDFNNDGLDDLLVGAYNAYYEEKRPGRVFLIFGRREFANKNIELQSTVADLELVGKDDQEAFGLSVQMGDINNDDIDDILVGAPFGLSISGVETGKVYGYSGSTFDVDSVDRPKKFFYSDDAYTIFMGKEKGERFGADIAVGDVIGGSYDDVIISAYFASGPNGPQTGKVYLYKGVKKHAKYERVPSDILVGDKSYDWFGFSIDAAEVDGHYKDDLLISTFPYLKKSDGGKVYVVLGQSSFDGENNINKDTADYYVSGKNGESLLGASIALGDLDGDGKNDFVLGAPGIGSVSSSDPGEIYVYYKKYLNGNTRFDVKNEEMISRVFGENADDWFGAKMTTLDFNNDGYDDLVVSSKYSDRFDDSGVVGDSNNGKVYLILGHSDPIGQYYIYKEADDEYVMRGDLVKSVIERFDVKKKRSSFIDSCYQYREFCFFAFSGQSDFSGLKLEPNIILYPDVAYSSPYYESVTIATMLGIVSGFGEEDGSPFRPDSNVTRIQALKIVLSATQLVDSVYRFQLIDMLGGLEGVESQESFYLDVDPSISHMWWYPRFANFAHENNLIEGRLYFRPDDYITKAELDYMIEKTLDVLGEGMSGDENNT